MTLKWPNNQGVIDVCEIEAPRGSIVNCVTPAPVASRALTCQRVCDMIIGALADALPEAAVGASNGSNTAAVFSGMHPETGEGYVYLETLGGGFGGRFDHDGKDGVQVHTTNTSNLPVEAIEMEYPLLVETLRVDPRFWRCRPVSRRSSIKTRHPPGRRELPLYRQGRKDSPPPMGNFWWIRRGKRPLFIA